MTLNSIGCYNYVARPDPCWGNEKSPIEILTMFAVGEQHCVVLMSGGIDSSSTIVACQELGMSLSGLFFDYGQPAAQSEWQATQSIATHYEMEVEKANLGVSLLSDRGEFFGRNALFIITAAGTIAHRPLTVAIGIPLSPIITMRNLFSLMHMERILNGYSGGTVSPHVPFLAVGKADIIAFARRSEVPLHLTYSCERQNAPRCGESSCLDRIEVDGG